MKKSIFLFFAAILCAMTANAAYNQSAVDLYFDNSEAKWNSCYVYIGHGTWTSVYPLTRVSGTEYLWKLAKADFNGGGSWNGATGWVLCYEKWWDSNGESIDKYTWHGDKNVTQKRTSAWSASYIYKTNGTASTKSDNHTITAYKTTTVSNKNYTVTINTVEGGTLTVKDYDDAAVATGASKIYLTVLKFSATPASGYVLDAVEINDGTNTTTIAAADIATTNHTLKSNVTINPVWRATTSTVTVTATATNGTVTGGGVVEEGTSVTLTATPADGYKFVNWTVGGAEVSTANPYTFTAEEDVTVVANFEELPKITLYFVDSEKWGSVNCHHWENESNATTWPGDPMTKVDAVHGFDIYKISYTNLEHRNCIFNGGGKQTSDLVAEDGKYYYPETKKWYATIAEIPAPDPLATNVYLVGEMNSWSTDANEFRKAAKDDATASVVMNLTAETTYKFKVIREGAWTGYKGTITKDATGLQFSSSTNDDAKITTSVAGDYTFTWTINSSKLAVTYPTICKVTATANDAAMGTVTGAGDYGKGSTATLKATPNDGYLFVNWTKGSEVASEDATYSFTVTEAVDLVANFKEAPEEVHNVTVSYMCGSTEVAEETVVSAVGVTTSQQVEAPEIFGYTFDSWTLGEDVTSADALKSNAIDINTVAGGSDFTLTAYYTEIPKVKIYVVNNKKWSKVYAYGWGGSVGENPGWPGTEITTNKEIETIAGFDVHSFSVVPGSYVNIKFTNGSGAESANFKWTDGKYYYMDAEQDYAGGTKEEVTKVLTPTYTVAGNNRIVFGEEWAPAKEDNDMVDQGDGTYKWTKSEIALKKNTEIKFKVVKNHDWEKGSWPGEDWVINNISQDGYYTITITFKESDKSITATATWTGEAPFKDFSNQPATLYFHPSFHWTSDNAEFAAYFYNEGFGADAEPKWADMTDSDGDGVYEVANAKQHEYVIICRMNPSRTENKWDENIKWNQIESGITIPNTAGDLNTCLAFWTNCQGDVPTSECTWVAPTPLTDKNWDAFVAAYNGQTINAVVERSFKSGQLHTLCLPFDLQTSWLGDGAKAYQITSVVSRTAEELELKTTQCNSLLAGQPYIIQPIKGGEYEHIIVSDVTVENVTAQDYTVSGGGCKVTMQAVSATDGTQTNGTTEYYIGAKDGKLYKEATNKLGLRALVVMTDTEGRPLSVRARVVVGENEATGFENITNGENTTIKLIENGQLIIIRNGEKFNAMGVKL